MAGQTPAMQQNPQSSEKYFKEKQYFMNTLYMLHSHPKAISSSIFERVKEENSILFSNSLRHSLILLSLYEGCNECNMFMRVGRRSVGSYLYIQQGQRLLQMRPRQAEGVSEYKL